ncbi:hypothetical protein BBO99_00000786 [Phytophthora kernoviae]|uniref:Uncharacterized protein n=1 Tax=Phytophthora kernoviae TaxID=325452 RepID=A0A3R7K3M2_9STRA|nr:hypothetical protein BBI17_000650 [Phytophthora kernoviae]RLN85103.1 hypothetical protein BBO99_00000786 [Phytophthora kernoviae]
MDQSMAPVKRIAMELASEDLQSEFARYGITAGDVNSRFMALQERYDEEYDTSIIEYETEIQKLEMERTKKTYEDALTTALMLEREALEREPKAATIIRQIEANVAPKRLVVRGISQLSCCALFRAMRNNSNVVSLDVSNNELSDIVGGPIGNMLSTNKKLRVLDLGFNKLTILSLRPIGNALRVNSVLTSLMLNSNQVFQLPRDQMGSSGSVSGAAVANSNSLSVKVNTGSSPSKASAQLAAAFEHLEPFTSALGINISLTTLNLFNTGIGSELGHALTHALAKNTSLISVEVESNVFNQSDLASIISILKNNQDRFFQAEAKCDQLVDEMKEQALTIQAEKERETRRLTDDAWHDENARKRAEIREAKEWERARRLANEEVQHMLDMQAENKKYLERLETEKKSAKGKK